MLYPIGWDALACPLKTMPSKNKVPPAEVTRDNIQHFRKQLKRLGFSL